MCCGQKNKQTSSRLWNTSSRTIASILKRMSFQNRSFCFPSYLQRFGYTALVDTVVVVGFNPQVASSEGSFFLSRHAQLTFQYY